jgi:hypothetical protein
MSRPSARLQRVVAALLPASVEFEEFFLPYAELLS